MRINTLCPDHISSVGGPSYACQALLNAFNTTGTDAKLHCISCENNVYRPFFRLSIPLWAKPLGYRMFSAETLKRYTEQRFLRSLQKGDLAYVWPGTSLAAYQSVSNYGFPLLTENVNTHQATSKSILDAECRRLGIAPAHGILEAGIADENSKLSLVDYVFSPSPAVSLSLAEAGLSEDRIIATSYGCDEKDILTPADIAARSGRSELTAIFVGRIGIRKGIHLLLDYWVKSGVRGKLKLVGRFEPSAMSLIEPYLQRKDIEHVPFTEDLVSVYRDADIFLLPSLEEGSPLVSYLALGAGLPSIVSPMGSGGIINDGTEGLLIAPHQADQWIESIRELFSNAKMRERFSANAYSKARHYLWRNVARRRIEDLKERMSGNFRYKPAQDGQTISTTLTEQ